MADAWVDFPPDLNATFAEWERQGQVAVIFIKPDYALRRVHLIGVRMPPEIARRI